VAGLGIGGLRWLGDLSLRDHHPGLELRVAPLWCDDFDGALVLLDQRYVNCGVPCFRTYGTPPISMR
jgi:hypothetical protein